MRMDRQHVARSKFLSYVLRHQPAEIGIKLDSEGWVPIDELLGALERHGRGLSREELLGVVKDNSKQRFAISEDGTRIRANQGHSVTIDLGLPPLEPPPLLYHGTAQRNLSAIRQCGLLKGNRHHVHLSSDPETAQSVGARHGKPVVLVVHAGDMHAAGHTFYRSENGVWLTDHVPPKYLAGLTEDTSELLK